MNSCSTDWLIDWLDNFFCFSRGFYDRYSLDVPGRCPHMRQSPLRTRRRQTVRRSLQMLQQRRSTPPGTLLRRDWQKRVIENTKWIKVLVFFQSRAQNSPPLHHCVNKIVFREKIAWIKKELRHRFDERNWSKTERIFFFFEKKIFFFFCRNKIKNFSKLFLKKRHGRMSPLYFLYNSSYDRPICFLTASWMRASVRVSSCVIKGLSSRPLSRQRFTSSAS